MKYIFGLVAGIGGLVDVVSAHCKLQVLSSKVHVSTNFFSDRITSLIVNGQKTAEYLYVR